ncbi:membrane progestin receptor gamma-A [Hydra vulgaris]|uniref:membrane progestin receptor gamma-A n=1 Tax=Hydra vulgaris TaxID=6087 RepID=UPI0006410B36|nr:membrane progestin receptor gamma-A-like [Hydra vulgaris]
MKTENLDEDVLFNLRREEVLPEFHDPFIITGYRKPYLSIINCVKSSVMFSCNESFNILSHFVSFVFFIFLFVLCFKSELDIKDVETWPLASNMLGNIGFTLMSTIAHTFNSMSVETRHKCFYLDYAAISIYAFCSGQAIFFYASAFFSDNIFLNNSYLFSIVGALISITSTLLNCFSRMKWQSKKYIIRTLTYICAYIWNFLPYGYRLLTCTNILDCDKSGLKLAILNSTLFLMAGILNVTKIPERFYPGKFDCCGQSHNLMHIFLSVGSYLQLQFIRNEMSRGFQPKKNYYYSLLATIFVINMNLLIAILFPTKCKSANVVQPKKSK